MSRFQQVMYADYQLYTYFLHEFHNKVEKEGPDFHDEVIYFKQLVQMTKQFCQQGHSIAWAVTANRWTASFNFTRQNCTLFGKEKTDLIELNYKRQHAL